MNDASTTSGLAVIERPVPDVGSDGAHPLVKTGDLPISKLVSDEERIEEEKFLIEKEEAVARRYVGIRGYLRLFQVTRVIGLLSLYLYLDQYDLHYQHLLRHKAQRLEKAYRLTRLA